MLGPDPTPAMGIGGLQWIAARFTVSKSVQVDHIGVNLAGAQTIFGAIVPLSGPDGLPTFPPDQIESFALASATFTAPATAADVSGPSRSPCPRETLASFSASALSDRTVVRI